MTATDPQVVVMKLIKAQWNSTSALPSGIDSIGYMKADGTVDEEVLIHTQFFNQEIVPMPQVAVSGQRTMPEPYGGTTEERHVIDVIVWVPRIYNNQAIGTLMNYRYQMVEEVKRILRANLYSDGYGIEEAIPEMRQDTMIEGYMATELTPIINHDL